ncbi:MAG: UDP-2,3-diacylglucosamine diphosphatase LpxI [Acetobacteraceae bacterium]|nr:UDP-2,3-diacylglucosamine diphosphatase LpxI [Acetobacteraceae bacterium]
MRAGSRLGIIAGGGVLPARVAAAARASGDDVFLVGLDGYAEPATFARFPHEMVRLGAAGRILSVLRERSCQRVVLIGTVRRPSLLDLRPDAEGTRILARIGRAAFAGDDGLLAAVIRVLRDEGFEVIGAHDVLRNALAPYGVQGCIQPDDAALADIARGVEVANALGRADVGQGCVVQQGIVLAVEAAEGTDAMLARCAGLARSGPGGVLVKLVKPGQERRADLPTLGLNTVRAAASAGLRGIAYEGEGALFDDRDAAIEAADAEGLFLIGLDPASFTSRNKG